MTSCTQTAMFVAARCMNPKRAAAPNFSSSTCVQFNVSEHYAGADGDLSARSTDEITTISYLGIDEEEVHLHEGE